MTTDSEHDSPIFKNLTKGLALERPNQLWIADLTYVCSATALMAGQRHERMAG